MMQEFSKPLHRPLGRRKRIGPHPGKHVFQELSGQWLRFFGRTGIEGGLRVVLQVQLHRLGIDPAFQQCHQLETKVDPGRHAAACDAVAVHHNAAPRGNRAELLEHITGVPIRGGFVALANESSTTTISELTLQS